MVAVSSKVKKWIDEGKDPRSAHWQAGLDKVLDLFLPDLEKGKIIPVRGMEDRDLGLMDFAGFSDGENKEFYTEFARTEEKLRDRLMHLSVKKG